jgi:CheY-like chemotaxis protein/two-component sensor histidine kinase
MTIASAETLAGELQAARARIAALEAELAEARRLEGLGRQTRSIAHDFSNIVAAISAYSELIAESVPHDSVVRRRIEAIGKATEWGQRLTQELIFAGRGGDGQPPTADLNGVVTAVARTLAPVLGGNVEVATELDAALRPVAIAAAPLERIVLNLMLNARDAMPSGGRIAVGTSRAPEGDSVVLRVSDTGIGMDAATRARVFEPYFTTKPAGRGSGLGLATVLGIVTQYAGRIELASEPGRGAVFTVTLPEAPARGDERVVERVTVLVVEPEPGVRDLVVEILELQGFNVLSARDHREAQTLCAAHDGGLALVVADAGGPGERAAARIDRLLAGRPDTPVLYLSGGTDALAASRDDGDVTLAKPFTVDAFVRKVQDVLDGAVSG